MSRIREWIETAEDSESVIIIADCASRLYRAGIFSAAVRYFNKVKELDPDGFRTGTIECTQDEASQMLAQRVVLDKLLAGLKEAEQAKDQSNLDEAIAILDEMLKVAPNEPAMLSSQGLYYAQKFIDVVDWHNPLAEHLPLLEEAEGKILRALELDPFLAEAHNNLGLVYLYAKKHKESGKCFLRALELKPDYPDAQRNLSLWRNASDGSVDK